MCFRDLTCLGTRPWVFSMLSSQKCSKAFIAPEPMGTEPILSSELALLNSESRAVAVAGADANH